MYGEIVQTKLVQANGNNSWATNMLDEDLMTFHGGFTYTNTESSKTAASAVRTIVKEGAPKTL